MTEEKISKFLTTLNNLFRNILILVKSFISNVIKYFVKVFEQLGKMFSFLFKKTKTLRSVMRKWERIVVSFFLAIIVFCSSWLGYNNYISNTVATAANGGIYSEGMISSNKGDVDQIIQKLTKIGLTYFDNNGEIKPALARKWDISDDGKIYTFYLTDIVDSSKIADLIKTRKSGWSDIQIETPEKEIIKFTLKEKYSPFLAGTAVPLFDFGPYVLDKQSNSELTFKSRKDFVLGTPYINELDIKLYPDQENLDKAFQQGKIMGLAQANSDSIKNFNVYSMAMPRYQVLFFNLNKEQFQKKDIRQKIKNGDKLDKEIRAVLVTSDQDVNVTKAQELKAKYEPLGLKIEIRTYDSVELQKNVIPNRDYDLLLYGIDYGYDPDPYPFWHTSQLSASGLNLSNFSNQKADALLEEARQTTDDNARKQKYDEFQKILDGEVPAIFLEQTVEKYAISKQVMGTQKHNGIIPADRFNEVWKWYLRTHRVKINK